MSVGSDRTITLLERCGAPRDTIRRLDVGPDLLRYWDLTTPGGSATPLVDLVLEVNGSPALFVRSMTTDAGTLVRLRRVLALRGDGSRLALYEPGRLSLYDVVLDEETPTPFRVVEESSPDAALMPVLLGDAAGQKASAARRFVFRLLREVTDALSGVRGAGRPLSADDALSLAGRALFLRFLFDRGIVTDAHVHHIAKGARHVEDLFATADASHATCAWLDATFNGNLLPLPEGASRSWFRALPVEVFHHLGNILHRAPGGQLSLPLGWAGIDFAHVPSGLLSEVYEAHCARHYERASAESVHYTPRAVADFMVSQSLDGLERPWEARVLDPAAGAGVFLVAAYRALVAARWRQDGRRPTRETLRTILNTQIVGFDINEAALRLAALSLYLTALELDPTPTPLDALRFDDLRGRVLLDVRSSSRRGAADAGSLGRMVTAEHEGRYDLVLGNPPWTAWSSLPAEVQSGCDAVAKQRGLTDEVTLADKAPDLAFLWRAMGWARAGGRIALALHARLLFRQSERGEQARNEVFRTLRVTGIVNGAALRQTDFWPDVSAPFCLLFAQNIVPSTEAACWFVSPTLDPELNDRGRNRVDMEQTRPVLLREAVGTPWTLKARFRGLDVDRELLARLMRFPSLRAWWSHTLGLHDKHQGYQLGGTAGKQRDASAFHGLPDLRPEHLPEHRGGLSLDDLNLPAFKRPTLLFPRARGLYRAPLVIVPKRLAVDRSRGRALLSLRDIFFCESYHGWSCVEAPDASRLAQYLFLLLNSELVRYVALLTSAQYGVERDTLLLEDIERFPVRPLDTLPDDLRDEMTGLADALARGSKSAWDLLDLWVARVYGLTPFECDVVRDALAVATPEGKTRALAPTIASERERWCQGVLDVVNAALRPFGRHVTAAPDPVQAAGPWRLVRFRVSSPSHPRQMPDVCVRHEAPVLLADVLRSADSLSVTEVVVREPDGNLIVARIDQYRYWTLTRARTFAARLLHEHGDALTEFE